ncbi:GDSL esterase/lipase At3g27950-like [Cornus florida]|uniref:GDSL esterase/lipase At3g27950-like n=1 Tax=Cornus florida TaxID=4283 RepID=UPI0028972E15|nr:GDSL esterase/lipase At3g27950-like [Cornus florida]XP_059657056.1 GDSL esterase/lipase At3g27950-like [Cornus florida]
MERKSMINWVFGMLLVAGLTGGVISSGDGGGRAGSSSCGFPAIYNFGDSNSDTGGRSAALDELPPLNGETFFGKPSGRFCDGRLIIDFIAENLGLPYLSAYLDSIGTNFRHGAKFATGGSSIRPGGYSPFHLDLQISQFTQFKSRTTSLYKQLSDNNSLGHTGLRLIYIDPRRSPPFKSSLPRPQDFSKALYTFDIGQNDIAYGLQQTTEELVLASISDILGKFSQALHQLYKEGARVFWIHNTGPIGCLPNSVIYYQLKSGNLDQNGCVKPQNGVAQEFNRQLKDRVSQLRAQLLYAAFTYVDVYSAKYAVISNAKNQGFDDPLKVCCGSYYGYGYYHIDCGQTTIVNRTMHDNSCSNPSSHISWDGVHYSEAANQLVTNLILNGTLSEPPVSISEACHSSMNV